MKSLSEFIESSKEKRSCFKACSPGEYCVCRNQQIQHNKMTELEEKQQELIDILHTQVVDLSMMSKIELGDDVIKRITKLQTLIKELK